MPLISPISTPFPIYRGKERKTERPTMEIDESFTKPGAVPFKWEIKPGVPKLPLPPSHKPSPQQSCNAPPPPPPQKLRPPPCSAAVLSPSEPRGRSFRSSSRTRSDRWRFDPPALIRADAVSVGCFPSPLLRRKASSKKESRRTGPASEFDFASDLETLSRWSVSSRKSLVSSFRDSPSSCYSSRQSSPRPVSDADWAGFGLF